MRASNSAVGDPWPPCGGACDGAANDRHADEVLSDRRAEGKAIALYDLRVPMVTRNVVVGLVPHHRNDPQLGGFGAHLGAPAPLGDAVPTPGAAAEPPIMA